MMRRIRAALAGWSIAHYALDLGIATATAIITGWISQMPVWLAIILGMCIFVAIPSAWAVWKHERRPRTHSIADICDELAAEGAQIRGQEDCSDWVQDVGVVLAANHGPELMAFLGITQPIREQEKPSTALVSSISRRGALFLRATAVRIRKVDVMLEKGESAVDLTAIAKMYDKVIEEADGIKNQKDAAAWLQRAVSLLRQTGQTLSSFELNSIGRGLSEADADIPAIMRQAKEFLEAKTAFAPRIDSQHPQLSGD